MGVFKNEVGRPTNKTILIRNILKGILVILFAAVIFASAYFLNKNQNKKENKTIDEKQAAKMIEKFNDVEFGYFYEKNRTVDNIDNRIILLSALNSIKKNKITKNEVKKQVEKIYGNIKYVDKSVESSCGEYNFSAKKGIYTADLGCSGDGPTTYSKIMSVKTKGDTLTIINKVAFLNFDYDSGEILYGIDPSMESQIEFEIGYADYKKAVEENLDSFNSYKWSFVKTDKGNYVFKSVKLYKAADTIEFDEEDSELAEVYELYKPFSYSLSDIKKEELYLENKKDVSTLSSAYKNRIAYFYYGNYNYKSEDQIELENDIVPVFCTKAYYIEMAYKKVFGDDTFDKVSFIGDANSLFEYNKENDAFCHEATGGEQPAIEFEKRFDNYEKMKDNLFIYENAVIRVYDKENNTYNYYNDINLTDKVYSGKRLELNKIDNHLKESLQKYKLRFRKENGNYVFKSIEKIK